MRRNHRGFTLIELLVVVAIIGILAAVISIVVASGRAQAHDAKTKKVLMDVRTSIENKVTEGQTFGQAIASTGAATTLNQLAAEVSVPSTGYDIAYDENSYALVFPLFSEEGYWCLDSAGSAGVTSGLVNTVGNKSCANSTRVATDGGEGSEGGDDESNDTPVITLTGPDPVNMCAQPYLSTPLNEPPYYTYTTANDSEDGDLTASITYSDVRSGPFWVRTYSVTDSGGMTGHAIRNIYRACP